MKATMAWRCRAYVPEVYMHQFWVSVYKHNTFYRFKMDKRKRFKLNMEIFRDIFKIFHRVQGQDIDALPTDEEIVSFLRELRHTGEINSLKDVDVDHMHQPWRTFTALINKSLSGKTTSLDKLLFSRAQILWGNPILHDLPWFAIGAIPPKKAQKFKKPASPKLTTVPVSTEAPTGKSKRVKRPANKSTKTPGKGVVIRETPEMPLTKKKEKKSMRDFYKSHPSGSSSVTKTSSSVAKIKTSTTSKGIGVKPGVLDVAEEESPENNEHESDSEHETDESESGSESDHDESEENEEDGDDDKDETKITDKAEGDEDEEMDFTTSQLYDDVDIRLNEPVDTDEGKTEVPAASSSHSSDLAAKFLNFSDIPHSDTKIVSPMDVYVHHEVQSQQTPTLLTVPVLIIFNSLLVFAIVVLQSLPSFTPPPQKSTSTPPPTTEATNPPSTLLDFASVFQFNNRITTLEKDVVELKKDDPLKTQAAATLTKFKLKKILIDKIDKSESYLAEPEHRQCYEGLKKSYDLDKTIFSTNGPTKGPKAKESQSGSSKGNKSQSKSFTKFVQSKEPEFEVEGSDIPQNQEENSSNDDKEHEKKVETKRDWVTKPSQLQEPTDPDWNVGKTPQQGQNQSWLISLASSAKNRQRRPAFRLLKGIRSNYVELEYDFIECYKALSEKLDWKNLEGDNYPFDLTKPLPLVKVRYRQKVSVNYFFNNDLKYLQGGILTMTYTTSLTKTKAAQYDLLGIKDMVPNIWSPVKVAYDKHALWGISH
nr:hypothetical protein [Tanacetum cinerariifolium]